MLGRMSESLNAHDGPDSQLEIIRLRNSAVELSIAPAAGGKIVELIDRRSGRNWLWRNPHIAINRVQREANYELESDSGGWDEVLLSVKPGRVQIADEQFASIPDHGDLVSSVWQVVNLQVAAERDVVCEMAASGVAASYRFRRRIRLPRNEAAIDFNYKLCNESDVSLPWYWCAHPLLAIEPDARIEIGGRNSLRVEDAATRALCEPNTKQRWPNLLLKNGRLDLSQSFASHGAQHSLASKVFVETAGAGPVSLVQGTSRLSFLFDPAELPWLGLWINNGAWSGCGSEAYVNLGIEPATTPYDCVNEAIENNAITWLQPGEEREWSLRVELQE